MSAQRFVTSMAERVALIEAGFVVQCGLGTNVIYLDLSTPAGRAQGEALLKMREDAQADRDRVGA